MTTLEHRADRTEQRRGRFDHVSERASFLASSPMFLVFCGALLLVWAVGLVLGASDGSRPRRPG